MSARRRCGGCGAEAGPRARFCAACGSSLTTASVAPDVRRIVTVLFIDLVDSTVLAECLDPEVLREAMDHYYATCTTHISAYGGVLEKFIGDAVMAVFGTTQADDDQALRAVRAAQAVHRDLRTLNKASMSDFGVLVRVHSGICSGEVVVAGDSSGVRVVGDAVHTAARLQSRAAPDEILICDETVRLTRARVTLEPVGALALKGRSAAVPAWRVCAAGRDAAPRDRLPMVGREREFARLAGRYAAVRAGRPHLLTIVGGVGAGKSRLLRDFLADPMLAGATLMSATCGALDGDGAYRPLADAIRSLPHGWAEAAHALRSGSSDSERAIDTLASIIGASGDARAGSAPEVAWAFRSLVEVLGRLRPLVLVLDDVHAAEQALLELIADLARTLKDSAVLLLCAARPSLPAPGSGWPRESEDVSVVELGPLPPADMRELLHQLAVDRSGVEGQSAACADEAFDRMVEISEGNPLYAELLVGDTGLFGASEKPPTSIRALIEAWISRLPEPGRQILECAAVVGSPFSVDAIRMLSDAFAQEPDADVLGMGIHQLVQERVLEGEGTPGYYRISRILTRETAYEMAPKSRRAAWHVRLAERISTERELRGTCAPGLADRDLARHLEAAALLTREIRPADPALPEISDRAAHALIAVGYADLRRRNLVSAVRLLKRGRELLSADSPAHGVLAVRISDAYCDVGSWAEAESALDWIAERDRAHEHAVRVCAVQRGIVRLRSGAGDGGSAAGIQVPGPESADALLLSRFHQWRGLKMYFEGRIGEAETAMRCALSQAGRLHDVQEEDRLLATLCELAQWSPTPAGEGIGLCDQLIGRFGADRMLLVPVLLARARLHALQGGFDEAQAAIAQAREHSTDLHYALGELAVRQVAGVVAGLRGERLVAALALEEVADELRELGHQAAAASLSVIAMREYLRGGDRASCERLLSGADLAGVEIRTLVQLHAVQAHLYAARGRSAEAAAAVAAARALLPGVDDPMVSGESRFELACGLELSGRTEDARAEAAAAAKCFQIKGASQAVACVRELTARWGRP